MTLNKIVIIKILLMVNLEVRGHIITYFWGLIVLELDIVFYLFVKKLACTRKYYL